MHKTASAGKSPKQVDFFRHGLGLDALPAVGEVLESRFITSGSVGKSVERDLTKFFGASHAFLTNSWTNGTIATLLALGIGPGDEVIVPAMTFVATANVVELIGAKPVFVDVDSDTLLMTAEAVAEAISPVTRAVIPVHLYGQMCDVQAIRQALGNRNDIIVIEDAAHCFEGSYSGTLPGTYSDAAVFSFYATKNVTCGDGGAVITNRDELAEALDKTRTQGMTASATDRFQKGRYQHWDMVTLGAKANLPDLLAAYLPSQIAKVRDRLGERERLAMRYMSAFENTRIRTPSIDPQALHARHLFAIHVPPRVRDDVIGCLNDRGIGVTVNYLSVPTLTYYREKYGLAPEAFPVSVDWGQGTLSLPLFPGLRDDEQDYVISVIHKDVVPMLRGS